MTYSEQAAVFHARDAAFREAGRVDAWLRFCMSGSAYAAGIAACVLRWSSLDVPTLLVIVACVAVIRAVGMGVLNVLAVREIQRIKARLPMPMRGEA